MSNRVADLSAVPHSDFAPLISAEVDGDKVAVTFRHEGVSTVFLLSPEQVEQVAAQLPIAARHARNNRKR